MAVFLVSALCGFSAMADITSLDPVKASIGRQESIGYCRCIRIIVRAQGLGGTIVAKKFLISTDALLKFEQGRGVSPFYSLNAWQIFTVGALEGALQDGRFGLGFDGFAFGEDADRGYSDILRTGAYLAIHLVRTAAFEMKMTHGYQYEKFRVNLGPETIQTAVPQKLSFKVNFWRLKGGFVVGVAFDPEAPREIEQIGYMARADLHAQLFRLKGVGLGVGVEAQHEFDPFRRDVGLEPESSSAGMFIDVSYVVAKKKKRAKRK